jgi:lysozyme
MNLSPAGLDAIERREGRKLAMYLDSARLPTIGVGHLLTKDELSSGKVLDEDWRDGISEDTATELLRSDLEDAEYMVRSEVHVPLVQYQYDALVSFTFNVGGNAFRKSTLLRLLNDGGYTAVPGQLRRWIYSAGHRDPGLEKRRESEIAQWENA